MPTQVVWPKTGIRGLKHGFVGQRAGARNDADLAGLMNCAGHDADLAGAGRDDAGTVRPDQARIRARQRRAHLEHVQHRNAFGDADDQLDAGIGRFQNRIGRERRRHVDHRRIRAGLAHRRRDGIEHRQTQMHLSTLARRHAADQLGTVGNCLLGMEGALLAGEALADHPGVFVDQNAHALVHRCHRFLRRIGQPSAAIMDRPQLANNSRPVRRWCLPGAPPPADAPRLRAPPG